MNNFLSKKINQFNVTKEISLLQSITATWIHFQEISSNRIQLLAITHTHLKLLIVTLDYSQFLLVTCNHLLLNFEKL